ncbi:transporter substrate-binding domain-containing protein [Burkholderia stagnalis]
MTHPFAPAIRRRFCFLLFLAAFLPLLFTTTSTHAGEPAQSTLDTVKSRSVLIAGVLTQNIPYGYLDANGANAGFDVDVARYLAGKLGVKLELRPITPATRIPLLVSGGIDVAIAATTITRERSEAVDFTWPYATEGGKILIRKGEKIAGLNDLDNQVVAFPQGLSGYADIVKAHPSIKPLVLPDPPAAYQAVLQGKAVATILDATPLYRLAQSNPKVEIAAGEAWAPRPLALAIRQNDTRWRNALNYALADLWRDDTYRTFYRKNFGRLPDPRFSIDPYGI